MKKTREKIDKTADGIYNEYITSQSCNADKGTLLFYDTIDGSAMDHVAICEGTYRDKKGRLIYKRKHAYSDKDMVVEDESYFTPTDCGSLNFNLFQQ